MACWPLGRNRPAFRGQKPRLLPARYHSRSARSLKAPQATFSQLIESE
jgi:hypothetical protein